MKPLSSLRQRTRVTRASVWRSMQRYLLIIIGSLIAAFGYAVFQVPNQIAAGGVSGLAVIINSFSGWPVGTMVLIMNIPLLILGYFQLGGWRFVGRTVISVVIFSLATDLFLAYLPRLMVYPLTEDLLLSALYGGIVGGIGGGLIYRAGGSMGGTSIPGRIIQRRTGQPLSQTFLYVDGTIVFLAGLAFGWELALYALLTLFINGLASDYTLEGPSTTRTATIITNRPQEVAAALLANLNRGVSYWKIVGGYTGQTHFMVMCTMSRSQVPNMREAVAQVDPNAFVTVGVSHQALGYGFSPLAPAGAPPPVPEPELAEEG